MNNQKKKKLELLKNPKNILEGVDFQQDVLSFFLYEQMAMTSI